MSNNSVTLHRVLKATPEKVYRAFTDSNAMSSCLMDFYVWSINWRRE
ncbi:MAG TPA: hypothetical protein VE978_08455 [Chitinophagales bacterium]|nr:hypothetical protein [Chitinophagales bacterium]